MHPHVPLWSRKAFTLIELLVVIAIIAILAVVVVLTLNPAELLRQSRDANRLSDLATLNSAISLYATDQSGVSGFSLGNASSVYLSLPDASSTCTNLGLATTSPSSIAYTCSTSTSSRNINNSGWIPINFSLISSGSPLGSLPVDPANQSSSGLYYTYYTNGSQFEATALFESQKSKTQFGQKPILPSYPEMNAVGSSLSINPLFNPAGLVGYWPMDEGTGSSTMDQSGSGNTGIWIGNASGTNNTYYSAGKVGNYAGNFDGNTNVTNVGNLASLQNFPSGVTVGEWVRFNGLDYVGGSGKLLTLEDKGNPDTSPGTPSAGLWFSYDNRSNGRSFGYTCFGNSAGGFAGGGNNFGSISYTFSNNVWYYLAFTVNASNSQGNFYINGSQVGASVTMSNLVLSNTVNSLYLGAQNNIAGFPFNGSIDDVRIYNRALSAAEIYALYNAGK